MKNLLKLHEAVVVVLLTTPTRSATFQKIVEEVEGRKLFPDRKGGISSSEQIKLVTPISTSKYKNWFEFTKPNLLKLK